VTPAWSVVVRAIKEIAADERINFMDLFKLAFEIAIPPKPVNH
jgi:hypothetical protein